MPIATPCAMFRILSVTSLLTRKALCLIIIPDQKMCLMMSGFAYVYQARPVGGGGGSGGSDEPPRCPRRSAFLVVSISRNGTECRAISRNIIHCFLFKYYSYTYPFRVNILWKTLLYTYYNRDFC